MNKAMLIGRLVRDVELKYTQSNKAVASITLACDQDFVKQGEERQADFLRVVIWDKKAEFAANYFGKGDVMYIEGRNVSRSYDDADGKKVYVQEIVATNVKFVPGTKNKGGLKNTGEGGVASSAPAEEGFFPVSEEDDELPF